jgi:hypothetical protein
LRGSETRPRVLGLILGHESISPQTHAFVRSFINRTAVKISITKSNVGLQVFRRVFIAKTQNHDTDPRLCGRF